MYRGLYFLVNFCFIFGLTNFIFIGVLVELSQNIKRIQFCDSPIIPMMSQKKVWPWILPTIPCHLFLLKLKITVIKSYRNLHGACLININSVLDEVRVHFLYNFCIFHRTKMQKKYWKERRDLKQNRLSSVIFIWKRKKVS